MRPKSMKRSTIGRSLGTIVPDMTYTKLKYTSAVILSSTASGPGHYIFRGNGPFDPDYPGTGAQPTGYDQWTQFYKVQRTLASSIRVVGRQDDPATSEDFAMMVIQPRQDVDSELSYFQVAGDAYTKTRMLPSVRGGYDCTMRHYMTTRKMFGLTKAQSADNDYMSAINTTPELAWYWHIFVDNVTGGLIDEVHCRAFVEITYYIQFSDRRQLNQS